MTLYINIWHLLSIRTLYYLNSPKLFATFHFKCTLFVPANSSLLGGGGGMAFLFPVHAWQIFAMLKTMHLLQIRTLIYFLKSDTWCKGVNLLCSNMELKINKIKKVNVNNSISEKTFQISKNIPIILKSLLKVFLVVSKSSQKFLINGPKIFAIDATY